MASANPANEPARANQPQDDLSAQQLTSLFMVALMFKAGVRELTISNEDLESMPPEAMVATNVSKGAVTFRYYESVDEAKSELGDNLVPR